MSNLTDAKRASSRVPVSEPPGWQRQGPGSDGANARSAHLIGLVIPMGPIRQVHADVLDIGSFETGPSDGQVVLLLHGYPYDIHGYVEVGPILAAPSRFRFFMEELCSRRCSDGRSGLPAEGDAVGVRRTGSWGTDFYGPAATATSARPHQAVHDECGARHVAGIF